jgi:amino acid adenylation domain-containing protein
MTGLVLAPEQTRRAAELALTRPHPFPETVSLVAELAARAGSEPDSVAVVEGDRRITWSSLRNRAARLREVLAAEDVTEGDVVAVRGPRRADTIALFLALESLGAIYLPLDTQWPEARVATVVERASAVRIVDHQDAPAAGLVPLVALPPWDEAPADVDALDVRKPAPDEPRYIIFTSGTTGMPKGAVVEQRGMLNHLHAKMLDLDMGKSDVMAFTAPPVFDISVWQMLIGVLSGAATVVVDDLATSFPRRLLRALADHGITVVELVPTVVAWISEELGRARSVARLPALRWCISTGEELHPSVAEAAMDMLPHVRLLNAYGPTECSDDVTHHEVVRADLDGTRLPIGAPIANAVLYVLVEDGGVWRAAEPGEPGELFVGGICVGRGYVADAAVTARAFAGDVIDPASTTGRLYRTGDLAVAREGVLHYLGRGDRQVKVGGVRMELDEIEAVLKRHPRIAHCAVIVSGSGEEAKLVAHYVSTDGSAADEAELAKFLGGLLPRAMVPGDWVHTERIPMTPNGKVDHKALARLSA